MVAFSCPSSPMATGHTPKKKPPPIAPKPRVSWTHSLPTTDLNYQLIEDPSSFSQVQVIFFFSNFDRCLYYASNNIQRAIHECNSNLSSQQKTVHVPILIIILLSLQWLASECECKYFSCLSVLLFSIGACISDILDKIAQFRQVGSLCSPIMLELFQLMTNMTFPHAGNSCQRPDLSDLQFS